ncbi:MAG: precorrin-2 C(20)-methyltransferase [Proteobacteria bacterium]|nr:precorrin-2 C(20)-methyltransferase [Pseudomonadota bacterium]MBU1648771.1 precorrin-2 C(20)-methyltransferase [Pseudomonadota bacterium]MBU1986136.1 precorrin-2 C(20)-methyltransferase [Pseudomonadota bacterium]
MHATLHIIGVGPGDPGLLTIKALNVLCHCPVIATPKASQHGHSTALSIVQQALSAGEMNGKEIVELHFPMKKIHLGQEPDPDVLQAWQDGASRIFAILSQGKDVAFPTLGDPAIYSTGYYLYATILEMHPEVRVKFVPGISAMSSCSATTHTPICLGDDMLAVVPATFSDSRLRQTLESFDTIVLMKVHRVIDHLIGLLSELKLLDKAVLVERVGMADERIVSDLLAISGQVHYFSTIIVRKK